MKITVCGSMAFYDEMQNIESQLIFLGHEVKLPELGKEAPDELGGGKTVYFGKYIEENGGIDAFPPDHEVWKHKKGAIVDHFEKIDWADAILVVNPEKRGVAGYVGGNTLIEIGVAFCKGKQIYVFNPISSELSYKQEIIAMGPVMLDGNVEQIV